MESLDEPTRLYKSSVRSVCLSSFDMMSASCAGTGSALAADFHGFVVGARFLVVFFFFSVAGR